MSSDYIDIGNGETLVLLHGLGSIKESWGFQTTLASDYRLVIPDLRGHGNSEINSNISVRSMAQDVLYLLYDLEIDKAHICGLSMGGIVAQEIYRLDPYTVKSLILSNTFHYIHPILATYTAMIRYGLMCLMGDNYSVQKIAQTCISDKYNRYLHDIVTSVFKINHQTYIACALACAQVDYRSMLEEIDVPTLLITAEHDEVVPKWIMEDMWKLIPEAEMVSFNTGHMPNIEDYTNYNRTLRRWLESFN